jgi:lipopolysaccharide/colanic/teichoic acid biosynthesis glycosyltransferase
MSEPVALDSSKAFVADNRLQHDFFNIKLPSPAVSPFEIPDELQGVEIPSGTLDTLEVPSYHDLKRIWEIPVALVLAIPALLMTGLLVILVRLTSKGPGIYPQVRSGKDGKQFTMYKLRSMYVDAEKNGIQWCQGEKDRRITPLGYWLRKLHLDELPQIINVVRGEMSFCGPRPERPQIVEKLEKCVPYYKSRLAVRPGITGFAQINLPADSDAVSVMKKQTLDLDYIESASFTTDLRMVGCTALRLIGFPGRLATKTAGLVRKPEDSKFSNYYMDLWKLCEKSKSNDSLVRDEEA